MYAVTRRYTVTDRGEANAAERDIREHFLPMLSEIPGFISYYAVDAGNRLETVSVFETRDGASESTQRAAEYVKQQKVFTLSAPDIVEGEVIVHRTTEHATTGERSR